jgi:hypothetical protein
MPKPLIILENHASTSAKDFIARNATNFKELGYKELLIEVNSELTPEIFKQQLSMIISSFPETSEFYQSAKSMRDMLLSLERNTIPYHFVDPETQEEANEFNIALRHVKTQKEHDEILQKRKTATKWRDEIIAPKIIERATACSGGVIYLGGFQHQELIKRLDTHKMDYYQYTMLRNSNENLRQDLYPGLWTSLAKEEARDNYYQTKVRCIDRAQNEPFGIIAARCELTVKRDCEKTPLIGSYFNKLTSTEYHYTLDENYVLTASKEFDASSLVMAKSKLSNLLRGVSFFINTRNGKQYLEIPGLNLPQNQKELSECYSKHGISKKP